MANVKTLRDDIKLLKSMDIDIVTVPGRPNKYCWGQVVIKQPFSHRESPKERAAYDNIRAVTDT